MSIVAIIPARGGSKRIPNKNIKSFAGQPIISYSIKAAQHADLFDRIIVSTDSEEIAEVAKTYGAEVPFMRPPELADDYATTSSVILHTLDWLKKHGENVTYLCCIYGTAPMIRSDDIIKGLEILKINGAASAFSVTTFSYPIFRGLKINKNDRLEMIWPENIKVRSQDLPEAYHDAGQFYWAKADCYLKNKRFLSDDAMPVVIPRYLVQDIDTLEDWKAAEFMFKTLQKVIDDF